MTTSAIDSSQHNPIGHLFKKNVNGKIKDGKAVGSVGFQRQENTKIHVALFSDHSQDIYSIQKDESILIGRDKRVCQIHTEDPTISRKHVRIYSIVFDAVGTDSIPPLVYVERLSKAKILWNGRPIQEGQGSILLSENDELTLAQNLVIKFSNKPGAQPEQLSDTYNKPSEYGESSEQSYVTRLNALQKDYTVTPRMIGEGAHGKVFLAIKKKSKTQVACKIVDVDAFEDYTATNEKIQREASILKLLRHPNIIRLHAVFRTESRICMFQELLTGGDLFSHVTRSGGFLEEAPGCLIILQVLKAVEHLHYQNIVHRDIKPENILLISLDKACRAILTDFGSAVHLPIDSNDFGPRIARMYTLTGTEGYAAPEIQGKNRTVPLEGYTPLVDMWAVGCVTAVVLTGRNPFSWSPGTAEEGSINADLAGLEKIRQWKLLRASAKDFVSNLIVLDEYSRLTASEALAHPWFTNQIYVEEVEALYEKVTSGWHPSN